jgi:cysteinyl-tRNA synthetase
MKKELIILAMLLLSAAAAAQDDGPVKMQLEDVQYWAYNIQDVNTARQREQLADTHFDLYVLEVVVTEQGEADFDIAGLVADIRRHNVETRGVDPIILAYADVGEAEDWRWYWRPGWRAGDPAWIVGEDPDGWAGNYPIAFWDPAWEAIVIYGHDGQSHVQATLDAGFDGIYLDWVEAFSDERVVARVQETFDLDEDAAWDYSAALMFDFIEKIRSYAAAENPDYLVVAQNAPDLYGYDSERYEALVDAIALEGIWYDGDGGFDDWADPAGYNILTYDLYPGWTGEVLDFLGEMPDDFPVFCVEYAQGDVAARVYEELAPGVCVPYATRRSLSQLSTTPYPPGYAPLDYE